MHRAWGLWYVVGPRPGNRKKAQGAKKNLQRAGSLARGALRARQLEKSADRFAIGTRELEKLEA